jgi:hypothetical protein
LLEYIYDDGNNISEAYKILINSRDNTYSFVSGDLSSSNNTSKNQLFPLDRVTDYYGIVNTKNYSFLQYKDYASGFPIRFDTIKVHLPINYTFGEYIGCYVKVFTFDYNNKKTYELSNFFFDISDVDQSYLLSLSNPALLFQEKLWGKYIQINVPSVRYLSSLRTNNTAKENTINYNLTGGAGLSITSPVFIDFHFINNKKTVNKVTTYYLTSKTTINLPQSPDFEKIGLKIEHSSSGDFFEIYGIYNGNISEFNTFIKNSVSLGKRYYVEYVVTLFEQNLRGKTIRFSIQDNFNEKVEYRPIIKFSTTTAIIDVEMRLIDAVDDSYIIRRASYGMLQDEVSKYSLQLMKINLTNAHKPKIYNIKSNNVETNLFYSPVATIDTLNNTNIARMTDVYSDNLYNTNQTYKINIKGDSKLVIEQLNGKWKCESPNIIELYKKCKQIINQLKFEENIVFQLEHIYRNQNEKSDSICNYCIENKKDYEEYFL